MEWRGTFEDLAPLELLKFLHLCGGTGVLQLRSAHGGGAVEFEAGHVVYARARRTPLLTSRLVESGIVAPDALGTAQMRRHRQLLRPPLARVLLQMGAVTVEQLGACLSDLLQDALAEIAGWQEGEFAFGPRLPLEQDPLRAELRELPSTARRPTPLLLAGANPVRNKADSQLPVLCVGPVDPLARAVSAFLQRKRRVLLGQVAEDDLLSGGHGWPSPLLVLWRLDVTRPLEAQLARVQRVRSALPGWRIVAVVPRRKAEAMRRLLGSMVQAVVALGPGASPHDTARGLVSLTRTVETLGEADAGGVPAGEAGSAPQERALEVLDGVSGYLARATAFLVQGGQARGVGGYGLTASGEPLAEVLCGLSLPVEPGSLLSRCLEERIAIGERTAALRMGGLFFQKIGRPRDDRAVLLPIVAEGGTLGFIYGDNGPAQVRSN